MSFEVEYILKDKSHVKRNVVSWHEAEAIGRVINAKKILSCGCVYVRTNDNYEERKEG